MQHSRSYSMLRRLPVVLALLGAVPTLLHAHPFHGGATGLAGGLGHPFSGFDHILAMLAVGIWGAQSGGRARWILPLSFVVVMALGGVLGASGMSLPMVEEGIIVSVLLFGVLIATAVRVPMWGAIAIVGLMGLFHGHAHGAEMPADATGLLYGAGFVAATTILHLIGVVAGSGAARLSTSRGARLAGAAIALGGLCLIIF
jgi:urease accessory protein